MTEPFVYGRSYWEIVTHAFRKNRSARVALWISTAMIVIASLTPLIANDRPYWFKATLPDEAKARLDKMVSDLKADPKGIYIEIEGHTDNRGTPDVNEKIGMERAEAVKRYLYEQHQVPLHKINVISYGEEKPVAPNNTRDGRAQNRRVVVKVLS